MNINNIFFILLLISQINIILTENTNQTEEIIFNAVFRIDSFLNNLSLIIDDKNKLNCTQNRIKKNEYFRIRPSNLSNSYYIESGVYNKFLGINNRNQIILVKDNELKESRIKWHIIKLKENEFLIQNIFSYNFLEIGITKNKNISIYSPMCVKYIPKKKYDNITNSFKFSFFKLFEEVQLKQEHFEIIQKEPIDVLIKYIDLSDHSLKREGISQVKKDEEHGEIRYSVRSILQNIPWIRKIFILMPNEKVKYFKPIEEISDKFVYVKDKDFLGFDSANSNVFQYRLFNMSKFGLSENFILMDDDCFIGKPLKKSDFFYYDEEQKKVLPCVVNDLFYELDVDNINRDYNNFNFKRKDLNVHSTLGFNTFQMTSKKILVDNFKPPLIDVKITHNAVPLNLNDMKEIYDLIKNKYPFANETLNSVERTLYDIQTQLLCSLYSLNVKKRKVKSIPNEYYDLKDVLYKKIDLELFVINTSGNKDKGYTLRNYQLLIAFLKRKFNKPTKYEVFFKETPKIEERKQDNSVPEAMKKYFENQNQIIKVLENITNDNKESIEQQKLLNKNFNRFNNLLYYFIPLLIIIVISIFTYILKIIYKINVKKRKFDKEFKKKAYKSYDVFYGEEKSKINN